jgi:hypothetical protein
MSMLSSSDYAYFYEDGRKMYHRDLGEIDLTGDFWEDEAADVLRDANIVVAGMLEPYVGIFVTDDGDVIDAQYRMPAVSMNV